MPNSDVITSLTGKVCLIYSSKTGNTKKVAESLMRACNYPLFAVEDAPNIIDYPILGLGFWVKRGRPDELMLNFMEQIFHKEIFFFCTHAAWPDSAHMQKCREHVYALLTKNQNNILGYFTCLGKVQANSDGSIVSHHPLTRERFVRLQEAKLHPNETDLMRAVDSFKLALAKARI